MLAVLAGPCLVFFRRRAVGDLGGWGVASIGGTGCWLVAIMLSPVPYPLPNFAGLARERHRAYSPSGRAPPAPGPRNDPGTVVQTTDIVAS
jgi:hypothetical protein